MMPNQLTILDRINRLTEHLRSKSGKKIIIWGAAENGRRVFQFCESASVEIAYFVDKRCIDKEDTFAMESGREVKILSPCSIKTEKKDDVFVLIASDAYYYDIRSDMLKWGFKDESDFINAFGYLGYGNKFFEYDISVRKYINDKFSNGIGLFKTIEIETLNRCNNNCSFCPVNTASDTREYKMMTEELFHNILQQLSDIGYKGLISIFSNNEPFLDKRIIKFLQETKNALPNAFSYLITNGTLLTMDKFLESIKYLDLLVIDNYDDGYEFISNIKAIYEYCINNPETAQKVRICKIRKCEVRTTRGGQAPNREKIRVKGITCLLPFQQMIVRPDGKVSLCCNDALGRYTLGDLNDETIMDVWYGKKYADIREKILKGRENLDLCGGCDTLIGQTAEYYMPYMLHCELLTVGR